MIFFELSYLTRFLWDQFGAPDEAFFDRNPFGFFMILNSVYILDGFSFTALFIFHYRNFKP